MTRPTNERLSQLLRPTSGREVDGYEIDAMAAELLELRRFHADVASVVGIEYAADHACAPGPLDAVLEQVRENRNDARNAYALRAAAAREALTDRQRKALARLLSCIGSWTAARWDQHLRYDVGDADTDAVIRWLAKSGVSPYIPDDLRAALASPADGET